MNKRKSAIFVWIMELREDVIKRGDTMGLYIVVADQRNLIRKVLSSLLATIPIVEHIYEAVTIEEVKHYLASKSIDLVLIHQSLVTDIKVLPKNHFVIFTNVLDIHILRTSCEQQTCGYILEENVSEDLLKLVLRRVEKEDVQTFFLDPTIALFLLDHVEANLLFTSQLEELTGREREVFYLLHSDLADGVIAKRLSISPNTVRSYVASISRKLNLTRSGIKHLRLPDDKSIKN